MLIVRRSFDHFTASLLALSHNAPPLYDNTALNDHFPRSNNTQFQLRPFFIVIFKVKVLELIYQFDSKHSNTVIKIEMIFIKPSFQVLMTIAVMVIWRLLAGERGPLAFALAAMFSVVIMNFQIYIILGLLYVLILCKDVLQWTVCLAVCVLYSCLMFCLWLADSIGVMFLADSKETKLKYFEAPYHRQMGNNEANNNKLR